MSDWYIEPVTTGLTEIDSGPEVEPFADGDLRVDRWTVSMTAPRFTLTIQGPANAS